MESVVVTTVAGDGQRAVSRDGVGTAASFITPNGICYSEVGDGAGLPALLVTDRDAHRIRCIYPASEERRSRLNQSLEAALLTSDALPIPPIILIILEFLDTAST